MRNAQGNETGVVFRRPVTDAVVAFLAAGTDRPIGDARAPYKNGDAAQTETPPYAIVYPIPGAGFSGAFFATPEEDAAFEYQVTSVGWRADQADWMADKVREVMLGRLRSGLFLFPLTVPGLVVQTRESLSPPSEPMEVEQVWSVAESFLIRVATDWS